MKIMTLEGDVIAECTPELAPMLLEQLQLDALSVRMELSDAEQKAQLRSSINQVADAAAREGIMSDVIGVIVVGVAQLTAGLAKAQTLADVRAATQPLAEIATAIEEGLKSGALQLPFMTKPNGAQGVLADLVRLSNGVSGVLTGTASADGQAQAQAPEQAI